MSDVPFPLTEIQYAYWVGRGPNFVLGNVCPHAYFELEGRRLNVERLTEAWRTLVTRHGMLRAVVGEDGQQVILSEVPPFDIPFLDLADHPENERTQQLEAIRAEMSHRVYDAATWPLHDIRVTRLPDHDRLHISIDLLMVDLASIALLFSEWRQLCLHPDLELPDLEIGFRDYVLALEDNSDSPRTTAALEYWTARARDLAPAPELPLHRSPTAVHKPRFSHREFHLPPEDWKLFQDRAQQRGLTATAVLATAFAAVLSAWSGTLRFTLNLTLFNRLPLLLADDGNGHRRLHPDLPKVVGDFTSICLLEVDADGEDTFADRVQRTQLQLQRDLRHRHVSALYALRERRRLGLQNGFETMPVVFTSGLGTVTDVTGPRDYFGDISYRISQTPQVWLDHQVVDFTGSLDLTWDAVEELFPPGVLDDMFATYCGLVRELAADDAPWDTDLPVLPPDYQLHYRELANDTSAPVPRGLLHEAVFRVAAVCPDRPAVLTSDGEVTFGELADRAGAAAAAVRAAAGDESLTDRLVGVVLPKGADQVAAALGVTAAGAAYLPVAPALPAQRRARVLTDGRAHTVLTSADLADRFEWPAGVRPLVVEALPAGRAPEDPGTAEDDLAYVIFTSGSTGTPKGVMIEHGAALNTVEDISYRFGIRAGDRVFGLAELGFDLSVYDVFGALGAGATLVLPDQDQLGEPAHWADLMHAHGVTVWNSVPAQMQMLVEHVEATGEVPPGLRLVMLSGDWIPVDLPGRITALWPGAEVIGMGGATEVSIWSIYHRIGRLPAGSVSVPYGVPLANQTWHVLDTRMRPCPEWVAGELYIGGVGLARGYWDDPEQTAASFVHHPETGERLYRTGDFGRYLPDGVIQFLGRRDGQVKINGHRVELGEIESVLGEHPGVDRAVAVKAADDGAARLLAFVTRARDDDSLLSTERGDAEEAGNRWRRVSAAEGFVPSGPSGPELTEAWAKVDDLHAAAAAAAFRGLGLGHRPGEAFQPLAAIRTGGVVDRYRNWVNRATDVLVDRGYLTATAGGLEVARELPETVPAEVADRARQAMTGYLAVPDDLVDWLLRLAGDVRGILTQDLHSAELYTSDRTPEVYERLFGPCYEVAAEAVRRLAGGWPANRPLRVLEVGGGYGSLTRHLLPLLPEAATEYLFTDISGFFLEHARDQFGGYPFVDYGMFDIDTPAESQGYDDLSADLLVAASVLHDAKQLRRTLATLRSTLAPGGLLLLVEQTTFHPWFDLTMGLQQGFDGFTDTDVRTGHPLLDRDRWRAELRDAGFTDVAVLTTEGGPAQLGFDVLVARAPAERSRFNPEPLLAFAAERLPRHMLPARVQLLDALPLNVTGKIDRAALAKSGPRPGVRGRVAKPPTTDRQRKLVEIWCGVLGVSHADLDDDFLEAGGDSLLAARLVAGIQTAFEVTVPVAVVLERPTVEALDAHLEQLLGPAELLEEL